MATLAQIRTSLTSTITSAIPGVQGYATVPEVTNLPAVVVIPRSTSFETAFGRGVVEHSLDVLVLISPSDHQLAQAALDKYVNSAGVESIREAVWGNRSLGLPDTEAAVTGMSDYGAQFEVGGLDNVGARLAVRVLTSGTA